jgi:hypothetical protein
MANKYCNLYGENKIKDDYTKINDGFAVVETDITGVLNSEIERETAETQREVNEVDRQLRHMNTKHYGEYNNDFVYHTNNIVSYQGSSFMLKENADGTILESQGFAPPTYPTEENERWKMVGKRGDKGDTGIVPNIQIGTVTTVMPSNPATVTRQAGSPNEAPVFDFAIPRGYDGTGVGDVLWADIDQDQDGVIDIANTANIAVDANKLGGQLPEYYGKESDVSELSNNISTHIADYVRQPFSGHVDNDSTETDYKVTLTPTLTAYVDGLPITIIPNVDCGESPTLNICGLGATPLLDAEGVALTAGAMKANKPYSFVRVGSNFFIRSPGGGSFIKSLQTGIKTGIGTSTTVSITSVDMSKAILRFKPRGITENWYAYYSDLSVIGYLSANNTIRFDRMSTANTVDVGWQVVEANVKSIQRGICLVQATDKTINISITNIDVSKAEIIYYVTIHTDSRRPDGYTFSSQLTSSSLTFERTTADGDGKISWQVVEYN